MKYAVIVAAVLLLVTSVRADTGAYYYYWSSPKTVNPSSIHVTVEGGVIADQGISDDRYFGYVHVEAPRDCVVIHFRAETDSGIPLSEDISWMDQCDGVYLPSVSIDHSPRSWWP